MPEPKQLHHVPRFLLEGFVDAEGMLHASRVSGQSVKVFEGRPEKLLKSNRYYDSPTESALGAVESAARSTILDVCTVGLHTLSEHAKGVILDFAAWQGVRTGLLNGTRDWARAKREGGTLDRPIANERLRKHVTEEAVGGALFDRMIDQLRLDQAPFGPNGISSSQLQPFRDDLRKLFDKCSWTLLRSASQMGFITSDSGLAFESMFLDGAIPPPYGELIYLPLSRTHVLAFGLQWKTDLTEVPLNDNNTCVVNRCIARYAVDQVVGSCREAVVGSYLRGVWPLPENPRGN